MQELTLFPELDYVAPQAIRSTEDHPEQSQVTRICGLQYYEDFISRDEELELLNRVDREKWLDDLTRRVQHYGYHYDYKARRIDDSMRIGDLPVWLAALGRRMVQEGIFKIEPDQVIVNEYIPPQGIAPHVDCEPCFDDTIVSLSLGSLCIMEFTHVNTGVKVPQRLEPRSIVVLQGDSRYDWRHSIPRRNSDIIDGHPVPRHRRVSLTFRKVTSSIERKPPHFG